MFINIRLKIRDFFKKYKRIILIVFLVWVAIIAINYLLKIIPQPDPPLINTYEPHTAVMDDSVVPEKLQNPIENAIKEFIEACNAKDYEKAYNLLTEECRKDVFSKIEYFREYVDGVFDQKKIYNIQNFSNKDGYYIYTVTILNDIMASGLTGEELETYEETFVMKEENGSIKIAIRGYIGNNKVDQMYEDEYLKVTIDKVKTNYETVTYYVSIRNKTDNVLVLNDLTEKNEIALNTDNGYRKLNGVYFEPMVIDPGYTKTYELSFVRYYDEKGSIIGLAFNKVRVLKSYTGSEETKQEELDNAVAIYSFELGL